MQVRESPYIVTGPVRFGSDAHADRLELSFLVHSLFNCAETLGALTPDVAAKCKDLTVAVHALADQLADHSPEAADHAGLAEPLHDLHRAEAETVEALDQALRADE